MSAVHSSRVRSLKEQVAYIDGLTRGLRIDENTDEGQILQQIIGVLDQIADGIGNLGKQQQELEEYVEEIDTALWDLENDFYEEDAGEETWEAECPGCGRLVVARSEDFDDDEMVDLVCPDCGTLVWDADGDFEYTDNPEEFAEGRDRPARNSQ